MEMPSEELTEEDVVARAVQLFFSADKTIGGSQLSRGAIIRAARHAFHHGLTNKTIKLQEKDDEKKLAIAFMTILDSWLVMKASQHKNKPDELSKEGE